MAVFHLEIIEIFQGHVSFAHGINGVKGSLKGKVIGRLQEIFLLAKNSVIFDNLLENSG